MLNTDSINFEASFNDKFESFDTLASEDPFGYVGQLAGYAQATNKRAGGWWVINKANTINSRHDVEEVRRYMQLELRRYMKLPQLVRK